MSKNTFSKAVVFFVLINLISSWACGLDQCDQCDPNDPTVCLTCHGWYEASLDTQLCVVSARQIIATVLGVIIGICLLICLISKLKDIWSERHKRPQNIQSLPSKVNITQSEIKELQWKISTEKMSESNQCKLCQLNGGSVKLQCSHVFHGDCISWQLNKIDNCPTCHGLPIKNSKIYCLKCLKNYIECNLSWYIEVKKYKNRICDQCLKEE